MLSKGLHTPHSDCWLGISWLKKIDIREESVIIFNKYNINTVWKTRMGGLLKRKTKKRISLLYLRQNETVLQFLMSTPAM